MDRLKALLSKVPSSVLAFAAFVGTFFGMGAAGYHSGNVVSAPGGAAVDPEFVRAIAAFIAAAIVGGVAKLPYLDTLRAALRQLDFVGLTADESKRLQWLSRDMPADWKPPAPSPPAEPEVTP